MLRTLYIQRYEYGPTLGGIFIFALSFSSFSYPDPFPALITLFSASTTITIAFALIERCFLRIAAHDSITLFGSASHSVSVFVRY